jgi:hypothetical protein
MFRSNRATSATVGQRRKESRGGRKLAGHAPGKQPSKVVVSVEFVGNHDGRYALRKHGRGARRNSETKEKRPRQNIGQ